MSHDSGPPIAGDQGLIVAGFSLLCITYVADIAGSFLAWNLLNPNWDNGLAFSLTSFIPIAGPFIQTAFLDGEDLYTGLVVAAGILQLGGLALIITGAALDGSDDQHALRSGEFQLAGGPGDVGIGLTGAF